MYVPGLGVRFGRWRAGAVPGRLACCWTTCGSPAAAVTLAVSGADPAGGPGPAGAQPRIPRQRSSWRSTCADFLTLDRHRQPAAARPALPRHAHRQPHREQRRALLRRPGEQADHRSRRPHHRGSGGHHPAPAGGPRRASSRTGSSIRSRIDEPPGGDRLRRLAPLGRGQHSADGEAQVSKAGQEYQPIGTLEAPRGSYTLKIGPVTRDFTVDRGDGALLRRPRRRSSTSRRATRVRPCGERRSRSSRSSREPSTPRSSGWRARFDRRSRRPTWCPTWSPGYPANEATRLGGANALETGLSYFSSALSQRAGAGADPGSSAFRIDLIEIRPGVASAGGVEHAHPGRRRLAARAARPSSPSTPASAPRPEPVQLPATSARASSSGSAGSGGSRARVEPTIQRCGSDFGHSDRLPEPLPDRLRHPLGAGVLRCAARAADHQPGRGADRSRGP